MTPEVEVDETGGHLEIRTPRYTARIDRRRLLADVTGADGGSWGRLRLLASVHALDGPDETVRVERVEHESHDGVVRVTVACTSSRWSDRTQVTEFHPEAITFRATVRGRGRVTTVHLLGGARLPQGMLPSGAAHRTVFSPNPDHPWRIARPAVEPAVISVNGEGGEPGVGRWLFTPAPTCFGLSRQPADDDRRLPAGPWLMVGLAAERRPFVEFGYDPTPGGFSLRCEYQGHTQVDGAFTTPTVLLLFGARDPYEGLGRYRDELVARGLTPPATPRPLAEHWRQPIFCGWGAQCALAADGGSAAPDLSRQALYDELLTTLAANDVVPGTVVVDDKWQAEYATCRADTGKWPDLAGFIAARHAEGQRVLLWWKAWDPEGAPDEACVRDPDGRPLAIDPESPLGRSVIEAAVAHMLGPGGLNADGLKVDFTGRTPSGTALRHAGPAWGFDLLHELLAVAYRAAKQVKPDSLIVTHTPDPGFLDVTDMVRLNDVLHLDHPEGRTPPPGVDGSAVVEQMTYRGRVVRAACPEMPVDTDGWCLPGQQDLVAYAAAAPALGVPALYYADRMDLERGPVVEATWSAIAAAWAAYRRAKGLVLPHRLQSYGAET
ncbi:hypothetical protein Q2K19_01305 [Micromonospora soli]|uniref:hypothetical protein n=1 Tax=Micromonospora sp. NBRC 110009 TaxID=3061627 RepID=UPI00267163FC|nr:hypothetical protein [Micromonospora sp. NBRC 110009]WKT99183.1 hypothetical protein Q2K19_01305 [Micromonospora sp. NBRC 110009]